MGPFWLPCHNACNFDDPNWKTDTSVALCAGAAIFRANTGIKELMPDSPLMLKLPENKELVFASAAEYLSYHHGEDVSVVEKLIEDFGLAGFVAHELAEPGCRKM